MKKLMRFALAVLIFLIARQISWAQIAPVGKVIVFNGIDQSFSIPNHSDFNIAVGESYTLAYRMRSTNDHLPGTIVSKGNKLSPNGRYEFYAFTGSSGPTLAQALQNADKINIGAAYLNTLDVGKWYHVAWVYNASSKSSKIYVDGKQVSTVINQVIGRNILENTCDLTVGCGWEDISEPMRVQFWSGEVDEFRVWKRALTSDDVRADCTDNKANSNGLVAAYDFEKILASTVPDVSGKGHNGQLFGYGIRVVKTRIPVGNGNTNERLVGFRINAESSSKIVTSITVDLSGTQNLSDLTGLSVYHNGSSERLNLSTARLFGTLVPTKNRMVFTGEMKLTLGINYVWVTGNISPTAREGNLVGASVISFATNEGTTVAVSELSGSRTILLNHTLLFSGGDAGSRNYRIPAIVTAKDGSLVTATDKRWNNSFDLPSHIDVVIRRSTNNGRTWSAPLSIAGEGTNTGFGDAALVMNRKNGEIICLFASDKGFFGSTAAAPIRIYQSKSNDNGISWSKPEDITPQIYGFESVNPVSQNWQGAFVTSGSAVQLKSGRIMAVMPVRETTTRVISNFTMYSDDQAKTWKVLPGRASTNGNEAKLVELVSGDLLMSIRNSGNRMFTVSKDRGLSWSMLNPQPAILDPYCNGDMIRYTSIPDGYDKNRILHSIPYSSFRSNVSVLMSYNEGLTWPVRRTICPEASAYSSLCVLKDGTIGLYYEVGEYETYQMYFARFSLNWLSSGTDTWIDKRHNFINSDDIVADGPTGYTIYPNPAETVVNISGLFERDTNIEIFNMQGQSIGNFRVEGPTNHIQFSVEGYSSGMYMLNIGGTLSRLVVK